MTSFLKLIPANYRMEACSCQQKEAKLVSSDIISTQLLSN